MNDPTPMPTAVRLTTPFGPIYGERYPGTRPIFVILTTDEPASIWLKNHGYPFLVLHENNLGPYHGQPKKYTNRRLIDLFLAERHFVMHGWDKSQILRHEGPGDFRDDPHASLDVPLSPRPFHGFRTLANLRAFLAREPQPHRWQKSSNWTRIPLDHHEEVALLPYERWALAADYGIIYEEQAFPLTDVGLVPVNVRKKKPTLTLIEGGLKDAVPDDEPPTLLRSFDQHHQPGAA